MWRWIWLFVALATLKCFVGIAGFVASSLGAIHPDSSSALRGLSLASLLSYSLIGGLLVWAGRRDRRAVFLGTAYLISAPSISYTLFAGLPQAGLAVLSPVAAFCHRLPLDTFLPLFIWLFFDEFPRRPAFGLLRTLPRRATWISVAAGCLLFGLFLFDVPATSSGPGWGTVNTRRAALDLYVWTFLLVLSFPAPLFALWKIGGASIEERRRVRLFLAGLALGLIPALTAVVLEAFVPPFARLMEDPQARLVERLILRSLLILSPVITAYSVLVNRILDLKLYVRRAIQYALTRYALLSVAMAPFLLLGVYIVLHREQTLVQLLSGSPIILSVIGLGGVVGLQFRSRLSRLIDRRFFREQYDSKQILAELVARSREARAADELERLLEREIDRALHLDSISVLSRDEPTGDLWCRTGGIRPLEASSALAKLLSGSSEPMDVDLKSQGEALRRLSREEHEWIAEAGSCLLVPLIASSGSLVGIITLGEKKSELPFSQEDRLLLTAIAASAALTFENRLLLATPASAGEHVGPRALASKGEPVSALEQAAAVECTRCKRLQPSGQGTCTACGGLVAVAKVPYILRGKFRLERRIGTGGMGIVYEAMDLELRRKVAIKTLPRVSPEHSRRLRHEARAMAAVSHPHVASIFGAETWHGTPMLIFEYLEGGTLADHLRVQRLEPLEALKLGTALCEALERLHAAGILHRDIKPSNIGYSLDRVPKLLDLGLAKFLPQTMDMKTPSALGIGQLSRLPFKPTVSDESATLAGFVVGTLAYLSPQALRGSAPDPMFDLWSLSVVLFQAIGAIHPFMAGSARATLDRILEGKLADIREVVPECPEPIVTLFADLLALNPGRRPAVAAQMRARLEAARAALR
jgi:Protein kinase domain/GAF domain